MNDKAVVEQPHALVVAAHRQGRDASEPPTALGYPHMGFRFMPKHD